MMINTGVNEKNLLIKAYVIKDLFRILIIVGVNIINHVILVEYLDYKNWECKKRLVNKLVERSSIEECTENIDEARLVEINSTECKYNSCTVYIYCVIPNNFYNQHWNW